MTAVSISLLISLAISFIANIALICKLREAHRQMEVYEHDRRW